MDLEPGTMDSVRAGPFGQTLQTRTTSSSVRPVLVTTGPRATTPRVLSSSTPSSTSVRKEAEGCDCLQGFQITHSLGGGTGLRHGNPPHLQDP
jgi:tubulin beta